MSVPTAEYRPRHPQDSDYYHCVEDYFETFVREYDEHFSREYGFWRPYVEQMIYRYLDCGDMRHGFARVKCKDCGHEYLLAFSCKRRHFCPACHQKRVVEFGEWLCMDVLKKVPHRHFIFSIPKILRRYFLYDRKLLAGLSRCAGESLKVFMQQAVPEKASIPGAVIAVQTFGDFLGFNPHCHILLTDGCFYGDKGTDDVIPCILEPQDDLKAFRKSWARLIQKIYEVDPLICPKWEPCASLASLKISRPSAISSRIWDYGLSGQGRRRKSMIPSHYSYPKPLINTRIHHINTLTVTPTPNTPGMNIFSHNAL